MWGDRRERGVRSCVENLSKTCLRRSIVKLRMIVLDARCFYSLVAEDLRK